MKKITVTLTQAEVNQLLGYIEDRQLEGWYYGNREQFEKREKAIMQKLKEQDDQD